MIANQPIETITTSYEPFLTLAKSRYSCRKYQSTPVEQSKLDDILEAARLAPTACNNQPQRIKMVVDPAQLALIDSFTPCRFDAPACAIVCYDKNVCWNSPFESNHNSGDVDVAIVVTHMIMEATELKLNTCWVMYFDPKKAAEVFDLPSNLVPVALLPIGYAQPNDKPASMHNKSITIEEMTIA